MTNLIPIIKKNLIITKRNPVKNIFSLFYPSIVLALLIYFLKDALSLGEQTKEERTDMSSFSSKFSLSNATFEALPITNYAIVGNQKDVSELLSRFIDDSKKLYNFRHMPPKMRNSML
jgi:hypothetical protein